MRPMASQISSLTYSGVNQTKYQSSESLAFVRGIHRWPVNSPHKGPVTRKIFPFDDVIMRLQEMSERLACISGYVLILLYYLRRVSRHDICSMFRFVQQSFQEIRTDMNLGSSLNTETAAVVWIIPCGTNYMGHHSQLWNCCWHWNLRTKPLAAIVLNLFRLNIVSRREGLSFKLKHIEIIGSNRCKRLCCQQPCVKPSVCALSFERNRLHN